jgi:drug/metabolite transporter (DMT)-like permease
MLSLHGGRDLKRFNPRAVGFTLATAITICGYTVIDGVGARIAGSAVAYSLALFACLGPVVGAYAFMRSGRAALEWGMPGLAVGLAGGALQVVSYSIAVWGMTIAPIALVAALRETSVLFGAIFAVVLLHEPLRASRIAAALVIVGGLVLIRAS